MQRYEIDKYIEKINEMYEQYPQKVSEEIRKSLNRLNEIEDKKEENGVKKVIDELSKYKGKFLFAIILIVILLIGLFNIKNNIDAIPMYYGGIIFFVAGYLIGFYLKGFGLIFLLSHGGTGFAIMMGSLLSTVFSNPIMSDNPIKIVIYLILIGIIIFLATILVIAHNLSDYLKTKEYFLCIPMLLYAISLFMAGLLPYIMETIYSL